MDDYENDRLNGIENYSELAWLAAHGIFATQLLDGSRTIYKAERGAPLAALELYSSKARRMLLHQNKRRPK